jgi:putative ABC transport system ATP-binding protein
VDDALIRCRSVVKLYGTASRRVQALRGVDLVVGRGRTVALVGPSGSGKSSLLRIIAGLEDPSAGNVVVGGVDFATVPERRRRHVRRQLLSHVYQRPEHNLIAHLTALQQVERVAMRRGGERGDADAMLTRVGLAERMHHRPHELSGGEQQRLAFARAAVGSPALIIADEPTAELDSASSDTVLDTIADLAQAGITVLIATHDQRVLGRVGEVVTLRDGAIASVRRGDHELSVIDEAGRMQIPFTYRQRFPDGRAVVGWDHDRDTMTVDPS